MQKSIKTSKVYMLLDFILLVLFVAFIPALLRRTVGGDVVEYENWFGDLSNPIEYRFGEGCWEITILLFKMVFFIVCQCKILKGLNTKRLFWTVVYHAVLCVLGLVYVFKYAGGSSFIYLIQCLMSNNPQ